MGIIQISVFQKNLEEGLNLSDLKALSSLKSHFLLLPEYFYADKNTQNYQDMIERSSRAQDWLVKLSGRYKGVIIGGTLMREQDKRIGIPILKGGEIVQWCEKNCLSEEERK